MEPFEPGIEDPQGEGKPKEGDQEARGHKSPDVPFVRFSRKSNMVASHRHGDEVVCEDQQKNHPGTDDIIVKKKKPSRQNPRDL
jgi:hypothetical protein